MKNFYQNYRFNYKQNFILAFIATNLISIPTNPCFAQSNITSDGTLKNEASQITPNINIKGVESELIEGGAIRGTNLFHSFSEFNIDEGRGAYFLIPNNNIENLLTRVTGNNPSNILGILGTISDRNFSPSNANLFLINPSGIVFGENSSLDLNGSFVGTTANAVEFENFGLYSASVPQSPSELLTVAPSAFLFSQINQTASIKNNSVADVGINQINDFNPKGLRVADGRSLLLLGGDVNINGGGLTALGGRIELGGYSDSGIVGLNIDGNNLSLNFSDDVEKSDVLFKNQAAVTTIADGGGSIVVNARNLQVTENSQLITGINNNQNSENKAGNIDINTKIGINLKDKSSISNLVLKGDSGQGGDINIATNNLKIEDESRISTETFGQGKGGNLNIDASDIQLIGKSPDNKIISGLYAQTNSKGDAGNLNIKTNRLLVQDFAKVSTSSFGAGNAGNLNINARDIKLIGTGILARESRSGLFTSTEQNSTGNAGNLNIKTNTLLVKDGVFVNTGVYGLKGNGGNLTIDAQDIELFSRGRSIKDFKYASAISTSTESVGNAGDLTIKTGELRLIGLSGLSTTTNKKESNSGSITIDGDNLQLKDTARITAGSLGKTTNPSSDININLKENFYADNGTITTLSLQSATGNININAAKNIFLRNGSNIITTVNRTSSSGGNITLRANAIIALEDSDILAFAPEGKGGNITFNSRVFLSDPLYRPTPQTVPKATEATLIGIRKLANVFKGNNRVDINASGGISAGTISGIFDANFLQNSLVELAKNPIDSEALVASSCVVRSNQKNGSFFITGQSSLPYRPGDTISSQYSAIKVKPIVNSKWKIGDPITEPSGIYRLSNGKRFLSRVCNK